MRVIFEDCGHFPSWIVCGNDFLEILDRIHYCWGSAASCAEWNGQRGNSRVLWI